MIGGETDLKKYVLEVFDGQSNTAGEKAKNDITKILIGKGYSSVNVKLKKTLLGKVLYTKKEIKNKLNNIRSGDIFVIQYPMYSRYATRILQMECKKRGILTVCLLHDLESLRLFKDNKKKITDEIGILKQFDSIIVHNQAMEKWLKENGVSTITINLQIFDYLSNQKMINADKNKDIVFAGNLAKSGFLERWDISKQIVVYGINPSESYPNNVKYQGVKSPDELPKFLSGSFGLVWDGDALDTNNGLYGEYTMYNNPHKVSLYVSSGLPVIVWSKAAIANFVKYKNIGFTVSSLEEIPSLLEGMSNEQYETILNNVKKVGSELRRGKYTLLAVEKAEKCLLG